MQERTCSFCGAQINKDDKGAVMLADGSFVCGSCAGLARIAFPRSMTWAQVTVSSKFLDAADSDEDYLWIDPLESMDKAGFAEAARKAEGLRAERRASLGPADAYFRVYEFSRIVESRAKGGVYAKDEYFIRGISLLGEVPCEGVLTASRREGPANAAIKRVEIPMGDGPVTSKAEAIPEGCEGRIIVSCDAPIYPGDVLAIYRGGKS